MEDSQPLSVESFSQTWLVNRNLSIDTPNRSFRLSFDGASFIEMDPNLPPSKRFILHQDFDFKLPNSQSQTNMTLVHADKLISNGTLVPLVTYGPCSGSPISSTTQREERFRKSRSMWLRKCNKVPKMIIQKYMDLVRRLWCRCRMRRGKWDSSRVRGVENWECSSASGYNLRRSFDSESSIHEAVVHCKKTIGMV